MHALCAAAVLDFIALAENCTVAELAAGDRLSAAVVNIFAPKSRDEARHRLSSIKMSSPLSVVSYTRYVMEFSQAEKNIPVDLRPGARALNELFLAGLHSRPLRDELVSLEIEAPGELRRRGIKIVSDLVEVQDRARRMGMQPSASKGATRSTPPSPGASSGPTCYSCGRVGHISTECRARVRLPPTPAAPPPQAQPGEATPVAPRRQPFVTPVRPAPPTPAQQIAAPIPPHTPLRDASRSGPTTRSMEKPRLNYLHGPALVSDATELPQRKVHLRAHPDSTDFVVASALLDSGSTNDIISNEVADRLISMGASMTPITAPVQLGGTGQQVQASAVLSTIASVAGKTHELEPIVMDTTYEAILGYPTLCNMGLIQLDQGDSLQQLLDENQDLFSDDLSRGPALVSPFEIQLTPDAPLIQAKTRRQPLALQDVVRQQVNEWLSLGIIEPSTSPFNSPVVLARKKDGSYRLCLDFRALNDYTVPFPFPLQHIGSCFERLSGSKYFCKLDLSSGFLQVPLEEDSRPYTAFSTPDGHYHFRRMPFGLKNAPLFFQSQMNHLMAPLHHEGVEVFLDDNIVHAPTKELLVERLSSVFDILRRHGLLLNKKKCVFGVTEIEFLGHHVTDRGIQVSPSRIDSLRNLPFPTTVRQLRQFLGAFNYVRDFLPKFSLVAKPLFDMLSGKPRKNQPLTWSDTATQAVDDVKALLESVPLLHFVEPGTPLVLECDASDLGVGAVLFQEEEVTGEKRVIAYVSSAFKGPSLHWSTGEKEAYAMFFAVRKLRHYLLGTHFIVRTDNKNLLFCANSGVAKIERWRLKLQEYSFKIEHIPGKDNTVADSLSRLVVNAISPPSGSVDISAFHGDLVGHHGAQRTVELMKEAGVSWPNAFRDVKSYIVGCQVCSKMKQSGTFSTPPRTTMCNRPFEIMSMDLVGPFPEDIAHNKYVLVLVDHFSRYVLVKALPDKTAPVVARALLEVIGLFGVVPTELRSDNGSEFTAKLTQEVLSLLGKVSFTVTDRPQSNGLVERTNQELLKHLRCLLADGNRQSNWSVGLGLAQRVVNTSVNSTTGYSPAAIVFGLYGPTNPSLLVKHTKNQPSTQELVSELVKSQEIVLQSAQSNQLEYLDKYLSPSSPSRGGLVPGSLVLAVHRGDSPPTKLAPRFRGPYRVLRRTGTHRYDVQHVVTRQIIDVHADHLKPYTGSDDAATQVAALDVSDEYLVDCIVAHKFTRRPHNLATLRFQLRWQGWGDDFNSWKKYDDVKDLQALDAYVGDHPELLSVLPQGSFDADESLSAPPSSLTGGSVGIATGALTLTDPDSDHDHDANFASHTSTSRSVSSKVRRPRAQRAQDASSRA